MTDVLLIWDARNATTYLQQFIEELIADFARYDVSLSTVMLSQQHNPKQGQIKPSMRAIFNIIAQEKPNQVITFGGQANLLTHLLLPTLKAELIANRLPAFMGTGTKVSSAYHQVANWIGYEHRWSGGENDYFYLPKTLSTKSDLIAYFDDDINSSVFHSLTDELSLLSHSFSANESLEIQLQSFRDVGLVVLSGQGEHTGQRIEFANALGIPVLVVAPSGSHSGVKNGYNGWVVSTTEGLPILNLLKNWSNMAPEMRGILSQYAHQHQSQHSGIRHFCAMLGYDRKKTFQKVSKSA